MKHPDYSGLVPPQYTGKEIEAAATIVLGDPADATVFYETAKDRLLDVNNWRRVAGIISAEFQLVDEHGSEVSRPVKEGDYIRIDIPGPGSAEGDGYDWARVEAVKEIKDGDVASTAFRVRPAANPTGRSTVTAHFYDNEGTSTFMVTREGGSITASIVDRNIKANDETASITDKVRNTAVGMSAIGSFSKIQWQNLANGLVERQSSLSN